VDALTRKLYTAMKDGPCWNVTGQLAAGEHIWNVAVFLHQRPDGRWRLGRPDDSEKYVLNHVYASIPARNGPNRKASNRDRRSLLNQIYEWIDKECGYAPEVASTTQTTTVPNRRLTTMANTCDIVKKWGLGERCTSPALENDHRCKLHRHLETLTGPLPTEKGDFRPERLKKVKKAATAVVEAIVPVSETPAAVMAQRVTPGSMADGLEEAPAPVEQSNPKSKRAKKTPKKAASPKA
jgi:hypothetical protein